MGDIIDIDEAKRVAQRMAQAEAPAADDPRFDAKIADATPPTGGNGKGSGGEPTDPEADQRILIKISTREGEVNDQAVQALAIRDESLYQREPGRLVTVLDQEDGSLSIRALSIATLRDRMARAARWMKFLTTEKKWKDAHPPDWSVAAVLDTGIWPGIRRLRGILECPAILSDGTILAENGYNEASGLYLRPNVKLGSVPDQCDRGDAITAASYLADLVSDFPFRKPSDQAAWVSLLLTSVGRYAIDGPCPAMAIMANIRGAGKTLLSDLVGCAVSGRPIPVQTYPDLEAELEKILVGIALAGTPIVCFDNVAGSFGCATLDKWLSTTRPMGRLLGVNETPDFRWSTIIIATMNNASITADTERRTVPIWLESQEEDPEERRDFKVPGIKRYVLKRRSEILAKAMIMLRAYIQAGKPAVGLVPMGGFEAWSELVRNACVWAGLDDPRGDKSDRKSLDVEANLLRLLLAGWDQVDPERQGITVAEAIREVSESTPTGYDKYDKLREAMTLLDGFTKTGSKLVGRRMGKLANRWIDGKRIIVASRSHGLIKWRIEERTSSNASERFGLVNNQPGTP